MPYIESISLFVVRLGIVEQCSGPENLGIHTINMRYANYVNIVNKGQRQHIEINKLIIWKQLLLKVIIMRYFTTALILSSQKIIRIFKLDLEKDIFKFKKLI